MATAISRSGGTARARGGLRNGLSAGKGSSKAKVEPKILHQTYFKSVGPRTYAAQVKELGNGNHLMVLTEGKRDESSGEVFKTRLFVYAEDFPAFFKMIQESAEFIKAHPVSEQARNKRKAFWSKQAKDIKPAVNGEVPVMATTAVGAVDADELDA